MQRLFRQHQGHRQAGALAALAVGLGVFLQGSSAGASSFSGRLALGPGYMSTSSAHDYGDSSGPALVTQLDLGVKLVPALVLHGTLIYDASSWLSGSGVSGKQDGSMWGFGLGGTVSFGGVSLGASAGGQLTFFPQWDDPASGPHGAALGPFVSANAGYVWDVIGGVPLGVHALARYRSSKDETNGLVYDPSGYQLGVVVSVGLDGEPLLGP